MCRTLYTQGAPNISLISTAWHLQKFPLWHLIPNLEKPTGGLILSPLQCLHYVGHCRQPQLEAEKTKAMSSSAYKVLLNGKRR